MISSTAASAGSPSSGSSGGLGLNAPTRRAQPGKSPRAAGARAGERRRARSSSPSSPATAGRALPAGSRLPSQRLPIPDGALLIPPNPHLGVQTHSYSFPPKQPDPDTWGWGGDCSSSCRKSASGCKPPVISAGRGRPGEGMCREKSAKRLQRGP